MNIHPLPFCNVILNLTCKIVLRDLEILMSLLMKHRKRDRTVNRQFFSSRWWEKQDNAPSILATGSRNRNNLKNCWVFNVVMKLTWHSDYWLHPLNKLTLQCFVYWCPETKIGRLLKDFPIQFSTNYILQGPSWETDSRSSCEDFVGD